MNHYQNEEIVDTFLDHIRYLKIAHHVSGRIRVKASWNGAKKLAEKDGEEIERIIAEIPGIGAYRVNKKAFSVVIEYNSQILPFSLWEDIGRLNEYPLHRESVKERLLTILSDT